MYNLKLKLQKLKGNVLKLWSKWRKIVKHVKFEIKVTKIKRKCIKITMKFTKKLQWNSQKNCKYILKKIMLQKLKKNYHYQSSKNWRNCNGKEWMCEVWNQSKEKQ